MKLGVLRLEELLGVLSRLAEEQEDSPEGAAAKAAFLRVRAIVLGLERLDPTPLSARSG